MIIAVVSKLILCEYLINIRYISKKKNSQKVNTCISINDESVVHICHKLPSFNNCLLRRFVNGQKLSCCTYIRQRQRQPRDRKRSDDIPIRERRTTKKERKKERKKKKKGKRRLVYRCINRKNSSEDNGKA